MMKQQDNAHSTVTYIEIDESAEDQRIDNFLFKYLKGVPKSRVYRIIRKGEIRVNKKRVGADYKLQLNDSVRIPPIRQSEKKEIAYSPQLIQQLKNRTIYEDENMLVINKPAGVAVHGGTGQQGGIIEHLRDRYPKLKCLELAHRLDKGTSGCLIIAKKRSILKKLQELMKGDKMTKSYQLLVKGRWQGKELQVDAPLEKNILQSGERIVKVSSKGKASSTIFKPIERYRDATLLRAQLLTGRTHQIRVHAAYLEHPVACDDKYGDKVFNKTMKEYGLQRTFLHAERIELPDPDTGQLIAFRAELDNELQKTLEKLPAKR